MLVQFSIEAQKPHYVRTCKCRLLQKNLQLCYSAILNVESHCSSIVKPKILFYSFSLLTISLTLPLSQLCLPRLSLSLRCLPLLLLSLCDFSLSLCSPSGHRWPPSPSNAKSRLRLTQWRGSVKIGDHAMMCVVCVALMFCSDCGGVGFIDGFAPMFFFF